MKSQVIPLAPVGGSQPLIHLPLWGGDGTGEGRGAGEGRGRGLGDGRDERPMVASIHGR